LRKSSRQLSAISFQLFLLMRKVKAAQRIEWKHDKADG
jgi:hypothetical protein